MKIKILFVCHALGEGGREKVLMDILSQLDLSRFRVEICILGTRNIYAERLQAMSIPVHALHMPSTALGMAKHLPQLLKIIPVIREFRPHIVQSQGEDADFYAQIFAYLLGVPATIAMIHGEDFTRRHPASASPKHRIKLLVQRWTMRFATRILAVSEATAAYAHDLLGVSSHRINIFPNTIPAVVRRYSRRDAQQALYGAVRSPVVGYVGRLSLEKNLFTALEALRQVAEQIPEIMMVFVGEGPARESLEQSARDLHVADRVRFVGYQEDPQRYYESFDAFMLPSFTEGMPLVLLEAQAFGVPVVATRVGGIPDMVDDGVTGILLDLPDRSLLAAALVAQSNRTEVDRKQARQIAAALLRITGSAEARDAFGAATARAYGGHTTLSESVARLQQWYGAIARKLPLHETTTSALPTLAGLKR